MVACSGWYVPGQNQWYGWKSGVRERWMNLRRKEWQKWSALILC